MPGFRHQDLLGTRGDRERGSQLEEAQGHPGMLGYERFLLEAERSHKQGPRGGRVPEIEQHLGEVREAHRDLLVIGAPDPLPDGLQRGRGQRRPRLSPRD